MPIVVNTISPPLLLHHNLLSNFAFVPTDLFDFSIVFLASLYDLHVLAMDCSF